MLQMDGQCPPWCEGEGWHSNPVDRSPRQSILMAGKLKNREPFPSITTTFLAAPPMQGWWHAGPAVVQRRKEADKPPYGRELRLLAAIPDQKATKKTMDRVQCRRTGGTPAASRRKKTMRTDGVGDSNPCLVQLRRPWCFLTGGEAKNDICNQKNSAFDAAFKIVPLVPPKKIVPFIPPLGGGVM